MSNFTKKSWQNDGWEIGLEPPMEAGAVSGWHGLGDFARDAVLQMDGGQCRDPATNLQVGKYTLVSGAHGSSLQNGWAPAAHQGRYNRKRRTKPGDDLMKDVVSAGTPPN